MELIRDPWAGPALVARQPLPERRRARRAPLADGSLVVLGAIVATALTLTASTGTSPAYAVTVNANGSVSVTLTEVLGVSGANEALARLGVRARIARIEAGCTQTGDKAFSQGHESHELQERMVETQHAGEGFAGLAWVIHPDAIPQGDTLLITAQLANGGRPVATQAGKPIAVLASTIGLYRGPAPTCQPPGTSYPG